MAATGPSPTTSRKPKPEVPLSPEFYVGAKKLAVHYDPLFQDCLISLYPEEISPGSRDPKRAVKEILDKMRMSRSVERIFSAKLIHVKVHFSIMRYTSSKEPRISYQQVLKALGSIIDVIVGFNLVNIYKGTNTAPMMDVLYGYYSQYYDLVARVGNPIPPKEVLFKLCGPVPLSELYPGLGSTPPTQEPSLPPPSVSSPSVSPTSSFSVSSTSASVFSTPSLSPTSVSSTSSPSVSSTPSLPPTSSSSTPSLSSGSAFFGSLLLSSAFSFYPPPPPGVPPGQTIQWYIDNGYGERIVQRKIIPQTSEFANRECIIDSYNGKNCICYRISDNRQNYVPKDCVIWW